MSARNIIGAICVGALRGQRINEVTVVRTGRYDEDSHAWWVNGNALVFESGNVREAKAHSLSYSVHENWIGGAIYPLYAEIAYPENRKDRQNENTEPLLNRS